MSLFGWIYAEQTVLFTRNINKLIVNITREYAYGGSPLEFCVTYSSWEGKYVSDVGNTCYVHKDSFKAETVACMLCAAELSEVEIPPVVFF